MADTSEGTIAVIAEVTPGTTPATPAFNSLRITGETLVANYDALVSNEIRPDATVSDLRRLGVNVSGDINFELHKDTDMQDLIAGALRGVWATNVLKGGVQKKAFTFERKIIGPSSNSYLRFAGSRISGLSLSFTPEEIVTGSLRVMGTVHAAENAIIAGATYTAADDTPPMAGIDVTSLAVSGIAGVDYSGFTLEVDNNMRVQRKLGSVAARGVGYGRRTITGTLNAFFEDLAAYEAFLNDETPSIVTTVSDGVNSYTITLPRIRITGGEVPNPGNDQDFMLALTYQATRDPTLNTDIQIARA